MPTRRLIAVTAATCVVAGPALAELPPYVYERARAEATDVVVFDVSHVQMMAPGVLEGECRIEGRIASVERGDLPAGLELILSVPCVDEAWTPRPGPFPGYRETALARAMQVKVWIRDGQPVLRGLDVTAERP
ncbi:hypothetical protein [Brevundimonas sp. FT23028]|uniref:hypothetical protein n=1 Tax=Brevundimonas sp. FT23028 TaxID=3393748 RepID=UPI003B58AF06